MATIRACGQCGTAFTPKREHAPFCSARCRMAWNREHSGTPGAPAAAIDWSVTAMTEVVERFALAGTSDLPRAAAALSEAVWWITLVDATLVRYHPRDYENTMSRLGQRPRRKTEETLAGLRYVRNQIGHTTDPAKLLSPGIVGSGRAAWIWSPQPDPSLADAPESAREWELSRHRAYQARLAGRDAARIFARCAAFLEEAAAAAASADDTALGSANASRRM
jgi:hypothetical protein